MSEFNFADSYRAGGLTVGAEILKMRSAPFEAMRKSITPAIAVDLARLQFGLPVPRGTDWFRDAFGAEDISFSMIDNQQEAAVLAASLLEAAMNDGKTPSAIVLVTMSASGLRKPLVRPDLSAAAVAQLATWAIGARSRAHADPSQIKMPSKGKTVAEAAKLPEVGGWEKVAELVKLGAEEGNEAVKALANQVAGVIKPLAADVADLREEVAMLWWHIGGWSRIYDRPFSDMDAGLAAILAGIDLSDLSQASRGPVAAPALLKRTITVSKKARPASAQLDQAVAGLTDEELPKLGYEDQLRVVPDACPILTAFSKAQEIGSGNGWHNAYKKATGLDATLSLPLLELAKQAFWERQFLEPSCERADRDDNRRPLVRED